MNLSSRFRSLTGRAAGVLAALAVGGAHVHAAPNTYPPPNYSPYLLWNGFWLGVGSPAFSFVENDMPDFDQKRHGLVGNGKDYCVPTSTLDEMYYLGDHGYPELTPEIDGYIAVLVPAFMAILGGSTASYMASAYLGQTARLWLMGDYMDSQNGTNEGDALDGEAEWLETHGVYDFFQGSTWYSDDEFNLGFPAQLMAMGGQVKLRIGWNKGDDHDDEDGRHMMMLAGVGLAKSPSWANDGLWHYTYRYANPASDEGSVSGRLDKQSSFVIHSRGMRWNSESEQWCFGPEPKKATSSWGCLNGYLALIPLSFLTGESVGSGQQSLTAAYERRDFSLEEGFGPMRAHGITLPAGKGLRDLAFDTVPTRALAVAEGSDAVFALDLVAESASVLAEVRAPTKVVAGGGRSVFVLSADGLTRIDRKGSEGRVAATVAIDRGTSGLGYDPVADRVVTVSERAVRFYDRDLAPLLALETPRVDGDGALVSAVDSQSGDVWLGRVGGRSLVRIRGANSRDAVIEAVRLGGVERLVTFAFAPQGRLVVNDGGSLRVLNDDGSPFEGRMAIAGQRAGDLLALPLAGRLVAHERWDALPWTLPDDLYGDDAAPEADEE